MLALLKHKSMNIVELAQELTIPVSSAAFHVNMLEEANLINTEMLPGVRGSQKYAVPGQRMCFCLSTLLPRRRSGGHSAWICPIGNYYDFRIHPTCGMVNEETYIDSCDDIKSFYSPGRSAAQLIWFQRGFVEYRFPNHFISGKIQIMYHSAWKSAPRHLDTGMWPSDITFSINDRELLTYTSPGDFGGRHGKLSTDLVDRRKHTQFGLLRNNQRGWERNLFRRGDEIRRNQH